MNNSVAVVILNWNGKSLLERFLPTVVNYTKGACIYVVDNCSTDDSVNFIQTQFPTVKVIGHETNCGFAEGYNRALFSLEEKYFVLLNSDVEVSEGWLNPLIDFLENNPEAATCQPKIKDYYNKDRFEYAGAAGGFIDKFGYPFCRGRLFTNLEVDNGQYDYPSEVFWSSGACLAVRSDVYKEIEGLDSTFFAHMEEIDFCWRVINRGFKNYCIPESTVYHVGGGTLSKISPRKTYLNFRNSLIMLIKNLHSDELIKIVITRLVLDGIAGIKFILAGDFLHCWSIIKAHFYCYCKLGTYLKTRKLRTKKHLSRINTVYSKSIVKDFFLNRKKKFSDLNIPNGTSFSS